jgi:hypothetical protein
LLDAGCAQAAGAAVDHRFEHALLVDEALGLQLVERPCQFAGFGFVGAELALQLGARVLSPAQQAQGPAFE